MARILVTGVGGPAGRHTVALLISRGHSVIGVDMVPIAIAGYDFALVPPAGDRRFLRELHGIVGNNRVELVIPTVSEELPVLAAADRVWLSAPVLISSLPSVLLANDKYLTCAVLRERGVHVPRFTLPSAVHSPEDIARAVGWPCVSKPRIGRGGREVRVLNEEDWPFLLSLDDRYILQEFAAGTDYAPNAYIGPNDGVGIAVVLEKTELEGGLVGNAGKVKRVDAPDVGRLAIEAATALGMQGPLDIDIRRRRDGTAVVLEINARFGANVAAAPEILDAAMAGVLG